MNQPKSDSCLHESALINTSPIRFNMNQYESDLSQHKTTQVKTSLKQVYITKNKGNMAKQNPNLTYQRCFLEI